MIGFWLTFCSVRLSSLSEQCQQWRRTLEAVQQARAKERQGVEQIISAKVRREGVGMFTSAKVGSAMVTGEQRVGCKGQVVTFFASLSCNPIFQLYVGESN